MAVYTQTVNVATTAATTTLTGWAPYIAVTLPSTAAAGTTVWVNTTGTAVNTGVDSVPLAGTGAVVTYYVKNRSARPEVTATVPAPTDPSAIAKLPTSGGTPISTIGSAAVTGVVLSLVTATGAQAVIG
jgi:hypothetical protein